MSFLQEGTILGASCRETLKVNLKFRALFPKSVLYLTHFLERFVALVLWSNLWCIWSTSRKTGSLRRRRQKGKGNAKVSSSLQMVTLKTTQLEPTLIINSSLRGARGRPDGQKSVSDPLLGSWFFLQQNECLQEEIDGKAQSSLCFLPTPTLL